MRLVAVALVITLLALGIFSAKDDAPEANGLVADGGASFNQEIFS